MAGRFLLDTTNVIDLFAGDPGVREGLAQAEEIFVSITAVGELLYGTRLSAREEENRAKVQAFVAGSAVLGCDLETSEWSARIKAALRAKGRPIPENDIWIAAVARQYGLTLAARDEHFSEVEGLDVVSWPTPGA